MKVWSGVLAGLMVMGVVTVADAQRTETRSASGDWEMGEYNGIKHAIGVVDFTNEAGWRGRWELGRNLSIMLESALGDTERFVIVDREQLGDVMREQDLAASGRMAQSKQVARTGVLRPAKYIASGAVTEATESVSGKDGGLSFRGFSIGGGKQEAQVTVIVKLIDSSTGEIAAQERIVGRAGRTGLRVGFRWKGLGGKLGGFEKTPLGEAAQDCISQAAVFIAQEMESYPVEGNVIRVAGNGQILINRGSEFGVAAGQEMEIREPGEEIIDPMTGAILGMESGSVIGRLRVARVEEKFAYCDVVSGEKNPAVGAVVYLQ
jgi:curli biogenesis system outer membrane secretion channel CsgG